MAEDIPEVLDDFIDYLIRLLKLKEISKKPVSEITIKLTDFERNLILENLEAISAEVNELKEEISDKDHEIEDLQSELEDYEYGN